VRSTPQPPHTWTNGRPAGGCAAYLPSGEHYAEELRAADRERAHELDERLHGR
jgi:hypothetical protein